MDGGEEDFRAMSDPDFLAERRRVRETIDLLNVRYDAINTEFDRRARSAWTGARHD